MRVPTPLDQNERLPEHYVEGVVTKIGAAENDKPGSIRLTVDPSQRLGRVRGLGPPGGGILLPTVRPNATTRKPKPRSQKDQARLSRDQANDADAQKIANNKEKLARDQAQLKSDVATRDDDPKNTDEASDRTGLVDLTIVLDSAGSSPSPAPLTAWTSSAQPLKFAEPGALAKRPDPSSRHRGRSSEGDELHEHQGRFLRRRPLPTRRRCPTRS